MPRPESFEVELTDEEFALFRDILEAETGIVLREGKRQLLKNRLRPLLAASGKRRYLDLLHGLEEPDERFLVLTSLIDAVTTNLTRFFREEHQFELLAGRVLPELLAAVRSDRVHQASLWSAGCCTGPEVWSLAMVVREAVPRELRERFRVLATDIDSGALARARQGRYPEEELEGLPPERRQQHLMRSEDGGSEVCEGLRELVRFSPRNLIHPHTWGPGRYHVIMCRNVLIYFDEARRARLLEELVARLHPGGYLFLGHAEGIQGAEHGLEYLAPSAYRRP